MGEREGEWVKEKEKGWKRRRRAGREGKGLEEKEKGWKRRRSAG